VVGRPTRDAGRTQVISSRTEARSVPSGRSFASRGGSILWRFQSLQYRIEIADPRTKKKTPYTLRKSSLEQRKRAIQCHRSKELESLLLRVPVSKDFVRAWVPWIVKTISVARRWERGSFEGRRRGIEEFEEHFALELDVTEVVFFLGFALTRSFR
jgi:hypothetical protein